MKGHAMFLKSLRALISKSAKSGGRADRRLAKRSQAAASRRICSELEMLECRELLSVSASCVPEPIDGDAGASGGSSRAALARSATVIRSLNYTQLGTLRADEAPMLTKKQLKSIPDAHWLSVIPGDARAAMSDTQVRTLNIRRVGLEFLTETQRLAITSKQLQSLTPHDFQFLSTAQIPLLSTSQIGSLDDAWSFGSLSDAARAALTITQIARLDMAAIPLRLLPSSVVALLTPPQLSAAHAHDDLLSLRYWDFDDLDATELPHLSPQQIATIPNGWWLGRIAEAARATLAPDQIQSLHIEDVGLDHLTGQQICALTPEQVAKVEYFDFDELNPGQVPLLTAEQIGTIPDGWWFGRMSDAERAMLTDAQVHALHVADVGIEHLTDEQVDELTDEQIGDVEYWDFRFLDGEQTPLLTAEQIASIPDGWWFGRMSDEAREALTADQVHALNIAEVGIEDLTNDQIDELTVEQIHVVQYWDFRFLDENQSPLLTVEQVASIPGDWWFGRMSDAARWALTTDQVQALNTAEISIDNLLAGQRDQLTVTQVQSLNYWDFEWLSAEQATHLTADQMKSIPGPWWFWRMSDTARAALSRDQLLSMDPHEFAHVMGLDDALAPPEHGDHQDDHPHDPPPPGPHPDDPAKRDEHLAVLALVPVEGATSVTIASGNWSDPAIWQNGRVPGRMANVVVSAGNTVTFDRIYTDPLHWVRVNGTLEFATNIDTQLLVDTIVVDPNGILHVGTADHPVVAGVAARIVIADTGPIDLHWDPGQFSRGLISHGRVEMVGENVTPFVALAQDPVAGDTQLTLVSTPTNWRIGDRLVLTGTNQWVDSEHTEDEELAITAIAGNVVTVDHALRYSHRTPAGFGLHVYVADMNRNVVVMSQNPAQNDRRGHVMFMHNPNVQVHNVGFYGLGRTDKRNPLNDPVFDEDGHLIENTGLNARGRYAVHFHRTGSLLSGTAAVITGSAVVDSPGWGYVNHDSNVIMEDNVAFHVVGASFVTEIGDEVGAMRRNLSIQTIGSGDGLEDRQDIFDFGHGGHGFWFQGPGVEVEDNISAGNPEAAFIFFTASNQAEFDARNLADPTLAAGRATLPVGTVPLRLVRGNIAFASRDGLETWFHLTSMNDGQSVIEDFTSWRTRGTGVFTPYTGNTTLRNVTVIGSTRHPSGTAFDRNNVTNNMTYDNVKAIGWEVGISVPVNRATVIRDGHFETLYAIWIDGAEDTIRTVDIEGDPEFVTLTDEQRRGETQYDIYLDGRIDMENRDLETLFSPDIVRLGTVRLNGLQVYYDKQAADYVPFPAGDSPAFIPPELIGKTNQQLWDAYGIAPAGIIAPSDAVRIDRINGLVGSRSTYLPQLELHSDKYTNELHDYQLVYVDGRGDLVTDPTRVNLREGWNLLTRSVQGHTRTFFVYGDVQAPTFQLDPDTDLRVNPKGLKFGFVVRGTVFDDSFGEMGFYKEFDDLEDRPILTRGNTRYILLEFTIRDLAGNFTLVKLELVVDPKAPVQPGTGQRDLPPREMPTTLLELLRYYLITGQTENMDLSEEQLRPSH
jgi:hypothetical protein